MKQANKELFRQMLHLFFGVLLVILIYFNIMTNLYIFILLLLSIMFSILSKKFRIPFLSWFLDKFEREHHMKRMPGKGFIFFLVGCLLVLKLFEKDIALASIMVLAVGDSISHISGIKGFAGKLKNPFSKKKFFDGIIFGTIAGALGALFFVNPIEACLGSLVAIVAESVEVALNGEAIDDNIIVPLIAGTTIYLLRLWFGI